MLRTEVDDHLFGAEIVLLKLIGFRELEVIAFVAILYFILGDGSMQGHDSIFNLHVAILFLFLIIFSKRVAFPIGRHEDAPKVGMFFEDYSIHVERFALEPVGRLPN